jgi:ABC-type nitrate/sulfonate/bicarbonate transport system substrate-binding protein
MREKRSEACSEVGKIYRIENVLFGMPNMRLKFRIVAILVFSFVVAGDLCIWSIRIEALGADRIRVALPDKSFGQLPLFIGIRSGLFKDEGLEVQWILIRSNVVAPALIAGEIDVAAAAGSTMRVAARGAPLKAFFFPFYKSTFVFVGAPEIKRVQDLKGKVIGTTGPRNSTQIAASMVLQQHGLNPDKDVTFFTVGGGETILAALETKTIHAMAVNPDMAFLMKKKGFHELGYLADLAPWPWGGYATSDVKLQQERDKIKRWTRAMVKSVLLMANNKEETIRIAMAEFGYPRDVTEAAANVSMRAINSRAPGGAEEDVLRQNIELTITAPLELKESPSVAKLVDFSLLREVWKELGIAAR